MLDCNGAFCNDYVYSLGFHANVEDSPDSAHADSSCFDNKWPRGILFDIEVGFTGNEFNQTFFTRNVSLYNGPLVQVDYGTILQILLHDLIAEGDRY